jgi:hypothetical protein
LKQLQLDSSIKSENKKDLSFLEDINNSTSDYIPLFPNFTKQKKIKFYSGSLITDSIFNSKKKNLRFLEDTESKKKLEDIENKKLALLGKKTFFKLKKLARTRTLNNKKFKKKFKKKKKPSKNALYIDDK